MKLTKNLKQTLFTLLLFTSLSTGYLYGQNKFTYAYDGDGNRIERQILMTRSATAPSEFFQEEISEQSVKIYPNPTKGNLVVELSGSEIKKGSVSIFNMSGRKIIQQQISNSRVTLDLSNYPAGVYLLKIYVDENSTTWKVIKE